MGDGKWPSTHTQLLPIRSDCLEHWVETNSEWAQAWGGGRWWNTDHDWLGRQATGTEEAAVGKAHHICHSCSRDSRKEDTHLAEGHKNIHLYTEQEMNVKNIALSKGIRNKSAFSIQGWEKSSIKNRMMDMLGLGGPSCLFTTPQLRPCNMKAAIDNT